jgi:hypothetical protein
MGLPFRPASHAGSPGEYARLRAAFPARFLLQADGPWRGRAGYRNHSRHLPEGCLAPLVLSNLSETFPDLPRTQCQSFPQEPFRIRLTSRCRYSLDASKMQVGLGRARPLRAGARPSLSDRGEQEYAINFLPSHQTFQQHRAGGLIIWSVEAHLIACVIQSISCVAPITQ